MTGINNPNFKPGATPLNVSGEKKHQSASPDHLETHESAASVRFEENTEALLNSLNFSGDIGLQRVAASRVAAVLENMPKTVEPFFSALTEEFPELDLNDPTNADVLSGFLADKYVGVVQVSV